MRTVPSIVAFPGLDGGCLLFLNLDLHFLTIATAD
jgi:hypothetical protein